MIELLDEFLAHREQTVLLIGGALLLALGALVFADHIWTRRRSVELDGVVAGFVNQGDDTNPMYYPVIDIASPGGGTRRAMGDSGIDQVRDDRIGRPVRVLFRPDEPDIVRVVSAARVILGSILSLAGIALLTAFFHAFGAAWVTSAVGLAYLSLLCVSLAAARGKALSTYVRDTQPMSGDGTLVPVETIRAATARSDKFNRGFSAFLAIAGAAVLAGGIYSVTERAAFMAVAQAAQGEIAGFERRDILREGPGDFGFAVYPVFRFETRDGRTVTAVDEVGTRYRQHKLGQQVPILYDPDDPNRARIDRGLFFWMLPTLLVGFGTLALLSGGVVWFRLRHRAARLFSGA